MASDRDNPVAYGLRLLVEELEAKERELPGKSATIQIAFQLVREAAGSALHRARRLRVDDGRIKGRRPTPSADEPTKETP